MYICIVYMKDIYIYINYVNYIYSLHSLISQKVKK